MRVKQMPQYPHRGTANRPTNTADKMAGQDLETDHGNSEPVEEMQTTREYYV
jgi:hypothetical protein